MLRRMTSSGTGTSGTIGTIEIFDFSSRMLRSSLEEFRVARSTFHARLQTRVGALSSDLPRLSYRFELREGSAFLSFIRKRNRIISKLPDNLIQRHRYIPFRRKSVAHSWQRAPLFFRSIKTYRRSIGRLVVGRSVAGYYLYTRRPI